MTQEEIMIALNEAYSLRDTLQHRNYDVPENLKKDIALLEKQYAEECILTKLRNFAAELLSGLRCELTLSINKDANGDVTVHNESKLCNDIAQISAHEEKEKLSAVEDLNDIVENESVIDNSDDEGNSNEQHITRGARKKFRVLLNGQEVPGNDGAHILASVIHQIGFRKVAALNIMHGEYNLVDRRKRTDGNNKWPQKINDWFIYTNTSNPTKIKELKQIAELLHLDLQVISL